MYAILLAELPQVVICSSISILPSSLNLIAYNPMRTTSANHADLLQNLLTSLISAGQRPFI
jgi:hypothetical protein